MLGTRGCDGYRLGVIHRGLSAGKGQMRRQFLVEPVLESPVQSAEQDGVEIERSELSEPRSSMQMGTEPILQAYDQALVIRSRPDLGFQSVHQTQAGLEVARALCPR